MSVKQEPYYFGVYMRAPQLWKLRRTREGCGNGLVDCKFWNAAADRFRERPGFERDFRTTSKMGWIRSYCFIIKGAIVVLAKGLPGSIQGVLTVAHMHPASPSVQIMPELSRALVQKYRIDIMTSRIPKTTCPWKCLRQSCVTC